MPACLEPAPGWLVPDWRVDARVRAFVTTRKGGVSSGAYASLNLGYGGAGAGTRDHPGAVDDNRRRVAAHLPAAPRWLRQVHGCSVFDADADDAASATAPVADAAVTRRAGIPLVILVADCMPVLLAARDGSVIGAAHAGWRGLAAGVLEQTLAAMRCATAQMAAWLGPCIGAAAFEVGADVREAFGARDPGALRHFTAHGEGKWLADLPGLARQRLQHAGVMEVRGGTWCTVQDATRFYSYRRDGATGRMGAFMWIEAAA